MGPEPAVWAQLVSLGRTLTCSHVATVASEGLEPAGAKTQLWVWCGVFGHCDFVRAHVPTLVPSHSLPDRASGSRKSSAVNVAGNPRTSGSVRATGIQGKAGIASPCPRLWNL